MPGGATLARAYGSSVMVGPVPFVGRVRRSRHPAYRRLPGWGHARRRYACAGLRIQFNGGLQCRLYAGYGVAAIRQTGGSLAGAMPGGATGLHPKSWTPN